jgi:hypothetical protein
MKQDYVTVKNRLQAFKVKSNSKNRLQALKVRSNSKIRSLLIILRLIRKGGV